LSRFVVRMNYHLLKRIRIRAFGKAVFVKSNHDIQWRFLNLLYRKGRRRGTLISEGAPEGPVHTSTTVVSMDLVNRNLREFDSLPGKEGGRGKTEKTYKGNEWKLFMGRGNRPGHARPVTLLAEEGGTQGGEGRKEK